jgi:hypothetical protein
VQIEEDEEDIRKAQNQGNRKQPYLALHICCGKY